MRLSRILVLLLLSETGRLLAQTPPPSGAKDLFYDPVGGGTVSAQPDTPGAPAPHPPAKISPSPDAVRRASHRLPSLPPPATNVLPKNVGLSYWIELEGAAGKSEQVSEHRIFRSGERIRLHFLSNVDGYVRLIQTGSSGGSRCLFPDPAKGMAEDRLVAGKERILPAEEHWFRFDDNPGTERLVALFGPGRADLERFEVKPEMNPQETRKLLQLASHVQGSKDLVIETETQKVSEVGTYVVNRAGGEVVLDIVLQHH